ncbi:MAG: hypothetical protein COT16_01205 [Elusimicrobia bacterium CG08_land_8_20_14_0_20_44_26]|nr:MAG: hypothetical protein COT16_01205 [Elusimicrobia bacterium CG08_land_8_20_14_0_20_44_26]
MIVLLLLLISFAFMMYFAGCETALCSLTPFQKDNILKKGRNASLRALAFFLEHPHNVLTAIIIGNAISVVVASVTVQIISLVVARHADIPPSRVSAILSGLLFVFVVFFGEIIPKTAAKKNPEKFASVTLPYLRQIIFFLQPLAFFLFSVNRGILSLLGLNLSKALPRTSTQEFTELSETAFLAGKLSVEERRMIKGVLDFPDKEVRQVMVPEVEINAVDINWGREKILREIAGYNHSRIPVYSGSLDNIKGLIYTKDIMSVLNYGPLFIINDIIRPPSFVPEMAPVETLLKNFMQGREHLSIVVDEYGRVTGLITLEDVLEEITGDIFDEFDKETLYKKEKDGSYIIPAQEDVDRVNDKLGIDLPEELAESIGGLILEKLNYLPKKGEKVTFGKVVLEIESAGRQMIKTVRVIKK